MFSLVVCVSNSNFFRHGMGKVFSKMCPSWVIHRTHRASCACAISCTQTTIYFQHLYSPCRLYLVLRLICFHGNEEFTASCWGRWYFPEAKNDRMCRLLSRGELFHSMVGLSSDHFHFAKSEHCRVHVQPLAQFVLSEKTGFQRHTSG